MKNYVLISICLLFGLLAQAQPDYKSLDAFLKKYIDKNGAVDYKAIKTQKSVLNKLVSELSALKVGASWSNNEQLAYWINLYNLNTIKLIVDNYPIKSIQNLAGGKPWDVKRVMAGGKKYSLNNIENDIIRAQFKDPRIHFAVNCGAKSCPPILNGAFVGSTLDSQLNAVTQKFINNTKYQNISTIQLSLSKIFDWYAVDFGQLITFLNKYSSVKIKSDASISFKEYDWSLNDKK